MEKRFLVLVAIYGIVILVMMACGRKNITDKKQREAQPPMATIAPGNSTN